MALLINPVIFDAAGVEVPDDKAGWSWDDLFALSGTETPGQGAGQRARWPDLPAGGRLHRLPGPAGQDAVHAGRRDRPHHSRARGLVAADGQGPQRSGGRRRTGRDGRRGGPRCRSERAGRRHGGDRLLVVQPAGRDEQRRRHRAVAAAATDRGRSPGRRDGLPADRLPDRVRAQQAARRRGRLHQLLRLLGRGRPVDHDRSRPAGQRRGADRDQRRPVAGGPPGDRLPRPRRAGDAAATTPFPPPAGADFGDVCQRHTTEVLFGRQPAAARRAIDEITASIT